MNKYLITTPDVIDAQLPNALHQQAEADGTFDEHEAEDLYNTNDYDLDLVIGVFEAENQSIAEVNARHKLEEMELNATIRLNFYRLA